MGQQDDWGPAESLRAIHDRLDRFSEWMSGKDTPKAAPALSDPYMLHNDPDIARANQSLRDADAQKTAPTKATAKKATARPSGRSR